MTYHLSRKQTVNAGIINIIKSQIDKAIEEIESEELDRLQVVHQLRKRCKKMRALIRLIRPSFPDYNKENDFFREAAGKLSYVRDAQSVVECFDDLAEHYKHRQDVALFEPIRQHLIDRRAEIADTTVELEDKLKTFRARMMEVRGRVETWKITEEGFDAIAKGFMKTYKRGREAFPKAYEESSVASFHEWRKRVKYHWYHCRLLGEIWPEMLKVHRKTAGDLADQLGDDYDLAVLQETLEKDFQHVGDNGELKGVFALIDERRAELQRQAQLIGERLYAEKKKHIAKRFCSYWMIWRREDVTN